MATEKLVKALQGLSDIKSRLDDDFSDRLSRQYTTSILLVFAFVVSTKQFVGQPISCWCPAHFTESHRAYTDTVCWISNTFYYPIDERVPEEKDKEWINRQMISYYQWVPLMLVGLAAMTKVPGFFWRFFAHHSGIDVEALMEAAAMCQESTYTEVREKTLRYVISNMDKYLLTQREHSKSCYARIKEIIAKHCFIVGGKRQGNYLTVAYLLVKLCYLGNIVGQLFLLDRFLGNDYHLYGYQIVKRLISGEEWPVTERFPRVTLCSFQIRHQARVHDYVVQCALTINLFSEKIFIIIWFWYVIVSAVTLVSMLQWMLRAFYWRGQINYVKDKLRAFEITNRPKGNVRKFAQMYLRRDGLFIIRLIAINVGDVVAAETLAGLWEVYMPERRLATETHNRQRKPLAANSTQKVDMA